MRQGQEKRTGWEGREWKRRDKMKGEEGTDREESWEFEPPLLILRTPLITIAINKLINFIAQ